MRLVAAQPLEGRRQRHLIAALDGLPGNGMSLVE